jgi:hypothetical protein
MPELFRVAPGLGLERREREVSLCRVHQLAHRRTALRVHPEHRAARRRSANRVLPPGAT